MSQFGFNLSFQLPGQYSVNLGYSNDSQGYCGNQGYYGGCQQSLYPNTGIQDTLGSINSFLNSISGLDNSISGNPYGLDFYGNNYNSPSSMAGLYGNTGSQAYASASPSGAQAYASTGNQQYMPQMQNQNPFMNMMNMMMMFIQMMMQMIMQMFSNQQGYNQGYNQNYNSPSAVAGLYGNTSAYASASPYGTQAYASTGNSYAAANSSPANSNAPMYTPQGSTALGRSIASSAERTANNMSSTGWCYRGVGRALAQNGINVSGDSAYMAADQLARNENFQEVQVPKDQLSNLPAGAVVVWDKCPGHKHGHISVALGDGREASDHIQQQMTNYGPRYRVFLPK